MDSLHEAFIQAPEPCEACYIMDARDLFDLLWTVEKKTPIHCNDNAWRGQDNCLYNSDWIHLKEGYPKIKSKDCCLNNLFDCKNFD